MTDENETGIVLGAMFDSNYKSDRRILYMRLSNDVQAQLSQKYEDLGKHRSIFMEQQPNYLNNDELDWKIKFNLDTMSDDNVYFVLQSADVNDESDGVKVNGDFKECEDVKQVVDLLRSDQYRPSDILFDFVVYQCKYLQKTMEQHMDSKEFVCFVNKNESAMCLVHADNDYYIYAESAKDALSAVRFALSRNSDADLIRVFVGKSMVEKDEQMIKLFANNKNVIVALDYDMHIDGH